MKKLDIQTPEFMLYQKAFGEWLRALGYCEGVVKATPVYVREFFHWLEQHGVSRMEEVDAELIAGYYDYLSHRKKHHVYGIGTGALSSGTLNNHLMALGKLADYWVRHTGEVLPLAGLSHEKASFSSVVPLTISEVKSLYEATRSYEARWPIKALRDRSLLALLYDCGLRRKETVLLGVKEVDFKQRTLLVRKGKNNKMRIVPFSRTTAAHLEDYYYAARSELTRLNADDETIDTWLLNGHGQRCSASFPGVRLREIQQHVSDGALQVKRLYPHLLRHSIATHLLAQGMNLEKVSRFLGHSSLDITQRYTHLSAEQQDLSAEQEDLFTSTNSYP